MSEHTPGPWQWVNDSKRCHLIHPHRGWLVVMDFVRLGMNSAQPRFATWKGDERENMGGIMRPARELDLALHPDARLIAAAPELLAACEAVKAFGLHSATDEGISTDYLIEQAISKARGT